MELATYPRSVTSQDRPTSPAGHEVNVFRRLLLLRIDIPGSIETSQARRQSRRGELNPRPAPYQGAEMTKLAGFKSTPFTGPGYYEAPYAEGPTSFQVPHLAGANPQSTIETVMKRVIRCSPQF